VIGGDELWFTVFGDGLGGSYWFETWVRARLRRMDGRTDGRGQCGGCCTSVCVCCDCWCGMCTGCSRFVQCGWCVDGMHSAVVLSLAWTYTFPLCLLLHKTDAMAVTCNHV